MSNPNMTPMSSHDMCNYEFDDVNSTHLLNDRAGLSHLETNESVVLNEDLTY